MKLRCKYIERMTSIHTSLFSDDTPIVSSKGLPGGQTEEEEEAGRLWRTVIIGDQEQRIDMAVIRPYLRVVTHGGWCQGMEVRLGGRGVTMTMCVYVCSESRK